MSGLINQSAGAPQNPGTSNFSNPLLQHAETQIESRLTPETRENYDKIVTAGRYVGLQGGTKSIVASLEDSKDPIADAAKGAVSLVLILRKQAQGIMPPTAMVYAAATLMLYALDFVSRAKIAQVGYPELVRAMHIWTDFVFARTGITKQGFARVATRVDQITRDPVAMQRINEKAGLTKHPQAQPVPPVQ